MKARLVPIFFKSADEPDFARQLEILRSLLVDEAVFGDPVALGNPIPETDGVVFPEMLGAAYRRLEEIQALPQPIMVITSEFGTVSMWDWEINSYLSAKGVKVLAPNTLEKAKQACRALALKTALKQTKFLAYQDNPASGTGLQDEIFKRFYWWEPECVDTIENKFGIKIEKKSFKEMAAQAREISDQAAQQTWQGRKGSYPVSGISGRQTLSAVKQYMQVKKDLDADPAIKAAGMNCLNESMFSDTTPCLTWSMLYEDRRLVWGCEGDLVSMLTKLLISETIQVPFMMTNLYPFLMGQAALKHEHIPHFPEVEGDPRDYILAAHCGYLGVVPKEFSTEWVLRDKVLAIVDDNATAIDARLPEGPVTLVKLVPPFDRWTLIEGDLPKYVQYPGSHCLNGAVIRVSNGPRMVDKMVSHHHILTTGHNQNALEMVALVFDLDTVVI